MGQITPAQTVLLSAAPRMAARRICMKRILVLLTLITTVSLTRAQDITGDWQGALDTGAGELRLVLHLTKASDGSLTAILDSVDQGASGIPVKSAVLKGSKLNLDIEAVHGTYEGTVAA